MTPTSTQDRDEPTRIEPMGPAPPDGTAAPRPITRGWARWCWPTLTSMRTGVILLTLLALAAIPGSVLPQRNVASDPNGVVVFYRGNPTISPWLDKLGLFNVYGAPWFAAIYLLLLLVSMTGCVLPRCRRLWQSSRSAPPRAPRNLARLEHHHSWRTPQTPEQVLESAATELRRRRYRVVVDNDQVRAERGYLREVGNLAFHLSLLRVALRVRGPGRDRRGRLLHQPQFGL